VFPLKPKSVLKVVTAFDVFFLVIFVVLDILFLFIDAPDKWKFGNKKSTRRMLEEETKYLLRSNDLGEEKTPAIENNTILHFALLVSITLGNLFMLIYSLWFRIKSTTTKNHGKKKSFFYARTFWGCSLLLLVGLLAIYDFFGSGGKIWEWGIGVGECVWAVWVLLTSKSMILAFINTVRSDLEYYYD
jgi:hypothetical protein